MNSFTKVIISKVDFWILHLRHQSKRNLHKDDQMMKILRKLLKYTGQEKLFNKWILSITSFSLMVSQMMAKNLFKSCVTLAINI